MNLASVYEKAFKSAIGFFSTTSKTGWGKNEIVNKLKEIETEVLRATVLEHSEK